MSTDTMKAPNHSEALPEPVEPSGLIWRIADRAMAAMARRSFAAGRGRVPAPAVERRLPVRVEASDEVADGVRSLVLSAAGPQPLPRWQPGSHVDVFLGGLQRQYSLCGNPAQPDRYRIAVRAISDGRGSAAMHALRPGDEFVLGAPRNAFPFLVASRYSFIAGGIGITPILAMIRAAHARGADWSLLYVGRSEASMPFLDELRALDASRADLQTGRLRIRPDDVEGPADVNQLLDSVIPGSPLYCCGPPPLIAHLRDVNAGAAPGRPFTSLHSERFSPAPVLGGESFEIDLARSGERVAVGADETALTALRRLRPDLAYSCQQGFCGTCRVGLLGGAVQHRDQVLSSAERNNTVMPCVSRGAGRIVVDL